MITRFPYLSILCFYLLLPVISMSTAYSSYKNNFLVLSDIHLNYVGGHVMEISPSKNSSANDLDEFTLKNLIVELDNSIKKNILPQPEFIIILGDIAGHTRNTSEDVLKAESTVFNLIKTTFPTTPIFYSFGNDDSLKINYGPFQNTTNPESLKSPYDIAKNQAEWKDGFLSTGIECSGKYNQFPCLISKDIENGYYSAFIAPKLRLISLNSVMFSLRRVSSSEKDAANQLQWLETQLSVARSQGESALITMHVPPGNNIYDHSSFWFQKEQAAFLKLIAYYQETIIGLIGSHTHAEELKIIKSSGGKAIAAVYLISALSTSHSNNPSVKTFYYSKINKMWQLSDYDTFHFTMQNNQLKLSHLYNFKKYYCDSKDTDMTHCLDLITADKMKLYFSAGNPNYNGLMKSEADIILFSDEFTY